MWVNLKKKIAQSKVSVPVFQGRSVKDWAMLNPEPKRRMKLLEFLDKTRMFAMSSSGQDLLMRRASSRTLNTYMNSCFLCTKV